MVNLSDLIGSGSGGVGGYRLLDRQIFTASGVWTKPLDDTDVGSGGHNVMRGTSAIAFIRLIGGGGGGGKLNISSAGWEGQGGGGGGVAEYTLDISRLGATENVLVGAGGAGASSHAGGAGGGSSFGDYSAGGGAGGGVGRQVFPEPEQGFGMDLPMGKAGSGGKVVFHSTDVRTDYAGGASCLGVSMRDVVISSPQNEVLSGVGGWGKEGLTGNDGGNYGGGGGGVYFDGTAQGGNGAAGAVLIEIYGVAS